MGTIDVQYYGIAAAELISQIGYCTTAGFGTSIACTLSAFCQFLSLDAGRGCYCRNRPCRGIGDGDWSAIVVWSSADVGCGAHCAGYFFVFAIAKLWSQENGSLYYYAGSHHWSCIRDRDLSGKTGYWRNGHRLHPIHSQQRSFVYCHWHHWSDCHAAQPISSFRPGADKEIRKG